MTKSRSRPVRPNFLWITFEDTSPRLGCYGDPVARTPYVDRLAEQGCRYTHAFSTAAVCAPSRFAVITGMYATSVGAHHMRTTHTNPHTPELPTPYSVVVPPYVKTFTEYLRAAGYFCTNNHKTDYQFTPPLTAWDECSKEAHWRHREENQPFFAVFNLATTHESGMWPRADRPLVTDPDRVRLPPYLPDTPKAREALARHYDNLAANDARVGQLLRELDEDGVAENTIVFLWSDHGEGLPRAKRWPYDAGIRVPLIVRWCGGIDPGSVCDDLVSLIDLGPTVLSLAGLPIPAHMQGQPFLGPQAQRREYVFAARDRHDEAYDMVRAVRDKRYKYIRHYHPELPYLLWIPYRNRHPVMEEMWRLHLEGKLEGPQTLMFRSPRPVEELYDVVADPDEIHNLADDPAHRDTLQRMRRALDEWRSAFGDMGDVPEAQMVKTMWPDGKQPKTAAPLFIPLTPSEPGLEATQDGGQFVAPVAVQIHCATQGASIAYAIDSDPPGRWRLYTGPVRLPVGRTVLRAKAARIGYAESEERVATFAVREADAAT
ncbi:MAG TPA: sulfatase [Limnochordia bacterium]